METAIRIFKRGCDKQFVIGITGGREEEVSEWLGLNSDNGEVSGMNFFK